MNDARDNIFNAIRQKATHSNKNILRTDKIENLSSSSSATSTLSDKLDLLIENLEKSHAKVHKLSKETYLDWLNKELPTIGIKKVLVGSDFLSSDSSRRGKLSNLSLQVYDRDIEEFKEELFNQIDAGITTTKGAISESGSLVLFPSIQEPRLLSLIPPTHIAIVNKDEIYDTFPEIMQKQNWASSMPTNVLLISGPSKTADIEQVLAYGVHGPKELIVIII